MLRDQDNSIGRKSNVRSFKKSGPLPVRLKEDEKCSLKRHYRNALREVIGILEYLANKDPDRFVWAGVAAITKRCNQFRKNKDPYHQRIIEYALAYFREQRAISKPVELERFGFAYTGFIVAPHEDQFRKVQGRGAGCVCQFEKFPERRDSSGPEGAT